MMNYLHAVLLSLLVPLAAAADENGALRAQVQQQVRAKLEEKLIKAAALDPATAQRVKQVWEHHHQLLAPLRHENAKSFAELRQLLQSGSTDDARIRQLTDTVLANRHKIQELEAQRQADVRRILTPSQFARLLLSGPAVRRAVAAELGKALDSPEEN